MSLINFRSLLKYGQLVADNFTLNLRSVATSNLLKNQTTVANEKENVESKPSVTSVSGHSNTTQAASPVKEDFDILNKQLTELKEKNSDLLDKYKRALADGENLRIRLTKQIEDARIYGIQNFCKDLLDVADVLNKATESVPKEQLSEKNPHLKSLYEGLVMTEAQLQTVFKRHGLEPVNPLNEKFDPNLHEALFQQEVQGKEAGFVVVVSKIGYKLHDRVIRPALVGVSK